MQVKVYVYILRDGQGYTSTAVVGDPSNNICIGGNDTKGEYHQYDSYEGYHAYGWAEQHGFHLECVEQDVEVKQTPTWWNDKHLASNKIPKDGRCCGKRKVQPGIAEENMTMTVKCPNCLSVYPTEEAVKKHGPVPKENYDY
jgi:hypothetical protein